MEGEDSLMATFLGTIGEFFTQAIEWCGEVLTTVTSNAPLTVLVLAFPICGFAVGLLSRLKRL